MEAIPFTNTEKRVMRLLGQGDTNNEIAKALSVSYKTIDKHVCTCYEKLHGAMRGKMNRTRVALWLAAHPEALA